MSDSQYVLADEAQLSRLVVFHFHQLTYNNNNKKNEWDQTKTYFTLRFNFDYYSNSFRQLFSML